MATFDQLLAAKMALPNCLMDRLILVYLNVVGGWCAAVKSDISKERCYDKDEEAIEDEEQIEVTAEGLEGEKRRNSPQKEKRDARGFEPRFADLTAVDRILALLTQAPLGSWVLRKQAPVPAIHVRLLAGSKLHHLVPSSSLILSSYLHTVSIIMIALAISASTFLSPFTSTTVISQTELSIHQLATLTVMHE